MVGGLYLPYSCLSELATSNGLSEVQATLTITLLGIGCFLGRLFSIFFYQWTSVNSHLLDFPHLIGQVRAKKGGTDGSCNLPRWLVGGIGAISSHRFSFRRKESHRPRPWGSPRSSASRASLKRSKPPRTCPRPGSHRVRLWPANNQLDRRSTSSSNGVENGLWHDVPSWPRHPPPQLHHAHEARRCH